jgi:hypothetical protein
MAGRIRSTKKPNGLIGNRILDLPACNNASTNVKGGGTDSDHCALNGLMLFPLKQYQKQMKS